MKRKLVPILALFLALLFSAGPLCGCTGQTLPASSSGTGITAPDSSAEGGSAPDAVPSSASYGTVDDLVPCPSHDPNLEVENQNEAEPALLIAPDGEENLWIWTPCGTDETLGALISTPAAPAAIRWPEEITAGTQAPIWPSQTALYRSGERILLCCAALESEQQAILFQSADGGASWSQQRLDLPFSAAGAPCFFSPFGEGGMSVFVSSAAAGRSICGFVQSAAGGEWAALSAPVTPPAEEQGAVFTWAGMISDRIGFVCCGYKTSSEPNVYATNDGGSSWFKLLLPLPEGFSDPPGYLVGSAAALEGDAVLLRAHWIVRNEKRTVTYRSKDQGASWQLTDVRDPVSRD